MRLPKSASSVETNRRFYQALALWGVFIVVNVLNNGTIPFLFGADLHAWTYSPIKTLVYSVVIYGGLFLVAPLILEMSWKVVSQPSFLLTVLSMLAALAAYAFFRPAAGLVVLGLAYLHWRFNLSGLGLRFSGWRGDLLAILFIGLLYFLPNLMKGGLFSFTPFAAVPAGLDRLFANPASTTENLFYFGFLAERFSHKTGRWTPVLIGGMYTLHEMSNPEYWYEGVSFIFTFIGVAVITAVYLWRRSTPVIWLGDGLGRFARNLF